MYVRYFVISHEWSPTRKKYVSVPFGSVDMAREHANVLALDLPKNRYYIVEAFEYAEVVPRWEPVVDFVQLEKY